MKPAAHGTKHCHRYRPLPGVRNVNVIVSWSVLSGHGALAHGFFAESGTPYSGTDTPICGIAKMCEAASGSIVTVGLPLSPNVPPMIPVACAMNGLRRPD